MRRPAPSAVPATRPVRDLSGPALRAFFRIAEAWRVHRACGMRLRTAWVRSSPNVHDGENFDRWEVRT